MAPLVHQSCIHTQSECLFQSAAEGGGSPAVSSQSHPPIGDKEGALGDFRVPVFPPIINSMARTAPLDDSVPLWREVNDMFSIVRRVLGVI